MATLPLFDIRQPKLYKDRRVISPSEFKRIFRFEKHSVEWMADHFLQQSTETRGGKLSHIEEMQTYLRYIADPGFQVGIGHDLGLSQPTVSRTINKVRVFKSTLNFYHCITIKH